MKKLLLAFSLSAALLFSATSCDIDVNITVSARAELIDGNTGTITAIPPVSFGPYSHTYLSEAEIAEIFAYLVRGYTAPYVVADLYLVYKDNILGTQKEEHYTVIPLGNGTYSIEPYMGP